MDKNLKQYRVKPDKVEFKATGLVLGNLWGGGTGGYVSRVIVAKTKRLLLSIANKMLKDGTLDGGMGFESLIGGYLHITKTTTKVIKGKTYENKEVENIFIGELSEKEQEFLINC